MKLLKNKFFSLLISLIMVLLYVFGLNYVSVKAENSSYPFDEVDVMEDISSIEEFNLKDYPKNILKNPMVLNLTEFCYSFYDNNMQDYALYLYIYNPSEKPLETTTYKNRVQMATAFNEDNTPISFNKFFLEFCSVSNGDIANRFYKFRILDTEEIAKNCSKDRLSRTYEISSLELKFLDEDRIIDYSIGGKYIFTGFAEGYGKNSLLSSNLKCSREDTETLSLDVRPTFYRTGVSNGKTDYTQDSLHSVYFAVPNDKLELYGEEIYSVHAKWLNAKLKPMVLLSDRDAYLSIYENRGNTDLSAIDFHIAFDLSFLNFESATFSYDYEYGYNMKTDKTGDNVANEHYIINAHYFDGFNLAKWNDNILFSSIDIPTFYGVFNTDKYEDNAVVNYVITSEEIKDYMINSYKDFGGAIVNGADSDYSSHIFSSIDKAYTDVTISATETFSLNSAENTSNWFERFYGINNFKDNFKDVSAITSVIESDYSLSKTAFCEKYKISESDYEDFMKYKNDNPNCTIFLFRYMVSDYSALNGIVFHETDSGYLAGYEGAFDVSTDDVNARVFSETVNLDFDVIDVTFSKDGQYLNIPVVASPQDIVHDSTMALNNGRNSVSTFLVLLVTIIIIILIIVLFPYLKPIFNAIVFIILLPFKAIGGIINSFKKSDKKKRK